MQYSSLEYIEPGRRPGGKGFLDRALRLHSGLTTASTESERKGKWFLRLMSKHPHLTRYHRLWGYIYRRVRGELPEA